MQSSPTPEISVLMPAFNREAYILNSVNSILQQTFKNFELIIIDDGSTDNTLNLIKNIKDCRVKVLINETNKGIAFSRNRLLDAAKGSYIALLDSDDIALPNRLQIQYDFLKKNTDMLLVGSNVIPINQKGDVIPGFKKPLNEFPLCSQIIKATLLFRNCFFQSTIMINKNLLGNFIYNLEFPPFEDFELWARISKTHKIGNLNESLVKYRYHPENISHITNNKLKIDLNARIALENFNYYFNYQPDEQELFIHSVWQYRNFNLGNGYLIKSRNWLKKIYKLNNLNKAFEPQTFYAVLKRNWFERCWFHLDNGYLLSPFHFLLFINLTKKKEVFSFFYLLSKSVKQMFFLYKK